MKFNVLFQEDAIFKVGFGPIQTVTVDNDYNILTNKPTINGVMLQGDQTSESLHIETFSGDYGDLTNKPSINGVTLQGELTAEDLGLGSGSAEFPSEGNVGDILMKTGEASDAVSWVTPASSSEEDNTRPITAAAVYTEIGNINALLATI